MNRALSWGAGIVGDDPPPPKKPTARRVRHVVSEGSQWLPEERSWRRSSAALAAPGRRPRLRRDPAWRATRTTAVHGARITREETRGLERRSPAMTLEQAFAQVRGNGAGAGRPVIFSGARRARPWSRTASACSPRRSSLRATSERAALLGGQTALSTSESGGFIVAARLRDASRPRRGVAGQRASRPCPRLGRSRCSGPGEEETAEPCTRAPGRASR